MSKGVLWIWMDEQLSALFRLRSNRLTHSPIERVCTVYSKEWEFAEIIFNGNEDGQLSESLAVLKTFFDCLLKDRDTLMQLLT